MAGNDVKSFAALVNNFTKVYAQAVLEIQASTADCLVLASLPLPGLTDIMPICVHRVHITTCWSEWLT